MYNSIVYQVGVFPYLSLSVLIFSPMITFERWIKPETNTRPNDRNLQCLFSFLVIMTFHFLTPLRHHFIKGNVFYTEEGHRLSWRMMLRLKSGNCSIYTQKEGEPRKYIITEKNHHSQWRLLYKCPMYFTYVQDIKKEFKDKGENVKIFADVRVGLNGRKIKLLIDPSIDLSKVEWNYFGHKDRTTVTALKNKIVSSHSSQNIVSTLCHIFFNIISIENLIVR